LLTKFDQSLVTDYYTPLLPTAHTLLSSTATTATTPGPSRVFATTHILRAIHLGLVNDVSDYFHSPTHFLPLLTTILSLLSHPATTTTSKSKSTDDSENDEDITIRVIAELAAHAILSEDHAKALNSGLSTLMRDHESAHVRLSAVKALVAVYARVGDEWLGLLPETVPFIAEVLEDEDEIVEREGQRLVAKIEEFLGVGELQGMLT
jgi:U3 small nucleolar RNA-associated protein 10